MLCGTQRVCLPKSDLSSATENDRNVCYEPLALHSNRVLHNVQYYYE